MDNNAHYQAINNYAVYNSKMSKSLIDKMFFVDKINTKCVVDFGCADGSLLKELHRYCPEMTLIGYDINAEELRRAEENLKDTDCLLTDNWQSVVEHIWDAKKRNENPTIILSSIVHEVYTYSRPEEIDEFWKKVFTHFKYVVIRDMIPSKTIDRASDINDVLKVYRKFNGSATLNDFQHKWGTIETNKNLVHFLLKYRYVENWKREVKENYLPLYREDLFALIPEEFDILYHEHYILPFIKNDVLSEFKIELKDNTHLKMILQNRI